jgi:Lrp/AsnC family transcriptional regulator, leucine-responsive regulatory protein
MKKVLDRKDWRILGELQKDGRLSMTTLAKRVGLSRAAATERMEALREAGVIRGFTVSVDLEKVGFAVSAYVRLKASTTRFRPLVRQVGEIPEVVELHVLSGADLMLARVVACSTTHLERVVKRIALLADTETALIFSTRKAAIAFDDELAERMRQYGAW